MADGLLRRLLCHAHDESIRGRAADWPSDMLIAAIARSHGARLITHNERRIHPRLPD
jgi:predicted nucleic acid-binding protein